MLEDEDINFDLQLKTFGVDMGGLKEAAIERVFLAWVVTYTLVSKQIGG